MGYFMVKIVFLFKPDILAEQYATLNKRKKILWYLACGSRHITPMCVYTEQMKQREVLQTLHWTRHED